MLTESEQQQLMVYLIALCFLEPCRVLLSVSLGSWDSCSLSCLLLCRFGVEPKLLDIAMKGRVSMAKSISPVCSSSQRGLGNCQCDPAGPEEPKL